MKSTTRTRMRKGVLTVVGIAVSMMLMLPVHADIGSSLRGGATTINGLSGGVITSGNLELRDITDLAAESLTNPNLTAGTSWTQTGEMALAANAATLTYAATGTGTFQQTSAAGAIPWAAIGGNAWFVFTYTTSTVAGTPVCTIPATFALTAVSLSTAAGTYSVSFQAMTGTVGAFSVACTSGVGTTITFDTLSLKQVIGGDLIANGQVIIGQDAILSRAAPATLQLGAPNAAAPVNQTLQAQGGTTAGTTGGTLTLQAGAPPAANTTTATAGAGLVLRGTNATAETDNTATDALGGSITINAGMGTGDTAALAAGGDIYLFPGIGGRSIKIVDYSLIDAAETLTFYVNNGAACVGTFVPGASTTGCPAFNMQCVGMDAAGGSTNAACATTVAAAINGNSANFAGMVATVGGAAGNEIIISRPANSAVNWISLSTSCAAGECTTTSANPGLVWVGSDNGTVGLGTIAAGAAIGFQVSGATRWSLNGSGIYPAAADTASIASTSATLQSVFVNRSIQGSKTKSLTDAGAAVAVIRVPIASNSYQGGDVIWNAQSTDATDYRTTVGTIHFAGISKGATPTCTVNVVGTDLQASSNANTLVCTWTNVVNSTNCDLSVTCTDNTAAAQTMSINFRADMPTTAVLVFP